MKHSVFLLVAACGLAGPALSQGTPGVGTPGVVRAPEATVGPAGVVGGPMMAPEADATNDYPTDARAEYVFACMATNGQTSDMLRRCSCSIDVIASILPYEKYVDAETVLAMLQTSGERVAAMRSAPKPKAFVQDLRRAQAEGSVRCF